MNNFKKILITGGTGFIGKNIIQSYLQGKYQFFAPTRSELDCSDDESVKKYFSTRYFDVVIHSAVKPGHRNATDTSNNLYINSRMMFNLLKYQDKWGKLLNMGSGAVYDMKHYLPKMKETYFGTYIPEDSHGYTKYILGKLLPSLEHVYDLRIFGVFGKYEDYSIRFISNAICKAIFDLPITMHQNRKFDYLYIDDLMPILEHFIENNPSEKAYNITPNDSVELYNIAEIVKNISSKPIEIIVGQSGMGVEYSGDNSLLRGEMPTFRFTSIENCVKNLYFWYLNNKQLLNKDLLLTDK